MSFLELFSTDKDQTTRSNPEENIKLRSLIGTIIISKMFLPLALASQHDFVFLMDSEPSLNRELDLSSFVGKEIRLKFGLENPVGLNAMYFSHLASEYTIQLDCLESFAKDNSLPTADLTELLTRQQQQNAEQGIIFLREKSYGQLLATEISTSGDPLILKIEDIQRTLIPIFTKLQPSVTKPSHGYEVYFVHTHPDAFPLGPQDMNASRRLADWISDRIHVVGFTAAAISPANSRACGSFSFFTNIDTAECEPDPYEFTYQPPRK